MSILRGTKASQKNFSFFVCAVTLFIVLGCQTTSPRQTPNKKAETKSVSSLAILYPVQPPEMTVNLRSDEKFLSTLLTGPAILPQIMLRLAFLSAKDEDTIAFNDMIFDLHIGETFCERLNTKLQLCSYFNIVPQEGIRKNRAVWELLEKNEKELGDYRKIGKELGIDTVLEISVLSYGIKDPGIFSGPYSTLKVSARMTKVLNGEVLWEDVIEAKNQIDMGTVDFIDNVYGDVNHLKEEVEKIIDIVSEECVERLGLDTHNTYLLSKDYREGKGERIDIAKKLKDLNTMRYDALITDTDYHKKKRQLIEKAKGRQVSTEKDKKAAPLKKMTGKSIKKEEKTRSGLPSLPRRD